MRELIAPHVVLWTVLAALATSCDVEQRECSSQNDCPRDFACHVDGMCVPLVIPERPAPPQPDQIVPGGGGSGGDGNNFQNHVQVFAPITMFLEGPSSELALLAQGRDSASGLDRLNTFNLRTGEVGDMFRDFLTAAPPCFLDTVRFFGDSLSLPLPAGDEIWFSCADGLQIEQEQLGFQQRIRMNDMGAELSLLVPSSDGTGTGADARLFMARRGDSTLRIAMFNSDRDTIALPRVVQTVDVPFTAIAGLFLLTVDDPVVGDMILVFDRSEPPRFVPLQRPPRSEVFVGPDAFVGTDLAALTLPESTHHAWFREDVGIRSLIGINNISDADRDTPNIVVFMPTLGRGTVRFLRYEAEQVLEGANPFIDLDLQANDLSNVVVPPARDRILFSTHDDGGDVFVTYALTRSNHVWRFPLHRNRNDNRFNEVQRAQFNAYDLPVGVLPVPGKPELVWVAYGNRFTLEALPFIPPF